jgi:hypothetical protein
MATIHTNQTTRSTAEQFIAGLTDFGPGRSELFGTSADDYLNVHSQGPDRADVTEGPGVWPRLHYDWSDPNRVVAIAKTIAAIGRPSSLNGMFPRSASPADSQAPTIGVVC